MAKFERLEAETELIEKSDIALLRALLIGTGNGTWNGAEIENHQQCKN